MKQLITFILGLILSISLVSALPNMCYFGDINGNCIIDFIDAKAPNLYLLNKPLDCSATGVGCDTLDIDGNGVIGGMESKILQKYIMSKPVIFEGLPNRINFINAPSAINVGESLTITLQVTDSDGTPRAGIGVDLILDNLNLATLTVPGTEVGDLKTNKIQEGGKASFDLTANSPGELTITAKINAEPSKYLFNDITEQLTITFNQVQEPVSPPSSGGDSSGTPNKPQCTQEHFSCTNWGTCQGTINSGSQSRSCEKVESCRGDFKPKELQSCALPSVSVTITEPEDKILNIDEKTDSIKLESEKVNQAITTRAITFIQENKDPAKALGVILLTLITIFIIYTFVIKKH